MQGLREQLIEVIGDARRVDAAEAQARLETRRYIVRVIDARDDWSKVVVKHSPIVLGASKGAAVRYTSLADAVATRNHLNKQDGIKSAWIIFE